MAFFSTFVLSVGVWATRAVAQDAQNNPAAQFDSPVMGYNSYNDVVCDPNQDYMVQTIDAMDKSGLIAAGYKYFQIDCGWAEYSPERNGTTGAININYGRFPRGLHWLSDYARGKGMKWSMYSDAGYRMCDPQNPSPVAGSLGFERQDAELFASLNTEYVKYDNCYVNGANSENNVNHTAQPEFPERYDTMYNELKKVNIHGMLVCQWAVPYTTSAGAVGPVDWTDEVSTSFRLSDDIARGWNNVNRIYNQAVHTLRSDKLGPGNWADADLLEVGEDGMTPDEQKTHFAAWAMFKSALMISTDVTRLSDDMLHALLNKNLIEINQNSSYRPINLVQRWTGDKDLWAGDLQGETSVLVVDLSNTTRTLDVSFADLNIASANVKNLWTDEVVKDATSYSAPVGAHGNLALRLSNIKTASPAATPYNWIDTQTGVLANGAQLNELQDCANCQARRSVGYIGGPRNGSVTLTDIWTSSETQTALFDYINAETHFFNRPEPSQNERFASVSVNGAAPVPVSFPKSGYNWKTDVSPQYRVQLSGFRTDAPNTLAVFASDRAAPGAFGPDLVRIGILQ